MRLTAAVAGDSQTHEFRFASGGLLVIDVASGHVEIRTGGSGEVSVTVSVDGGDLGIKTGGGHIEIGGVEGALSVNTGGGHVEVQDVRGDVSARSGGGHISIGDVEAHARYGEVEAPRSVRGGRDGEDRLETTIGRGGSLLKLYTHDGDIRISEDR